MSLEALVGTARAAPIGMMSRHLILGVLGFASLLWASTSCTPSTSLVTSWHDPSYRSGALRKPLVVALANRQLVRLKLEDELVRGLRGAGVDAVAGHTLFAQPQLDVATLRDKLPSTDRDSVMVTHLVDVRTETVVVPGEAELYPMPPPDYPRFDSWGNDYAYSYGVVTSPGYTYETNKKYILQTNLDDGKSEKLVWTAVTESQEPTDLDPAIVSFANVIVKDVQKNRLF